MVLLMILLSILAVAMRIVNCVAPVLFIVFLVLKLIGVITWSWFLVCLPLIIFGISILISVVLVVINEFIK